MTRTKILTGLVLFLILASATLAGVPSLINYQGLLRTAGGTPVPDASYPVTFKIYTDSVSGTVLWTETKTVTTSGGLFSTLLGSVTPVPDSAFGTASSYLGIKIGVDPEISPRQQLASVPYANRVGSLMGVSGPVSVDTTSDTTIISPGGLMGAFGEELLDCVPLPPTWPFWWIQLPYPTPFSKAAVLTMYSQGPTPIRTISLVGSTGNLYAKGKGTIGALHSNLGDFSFVAGCHNTVTAAGQYATIPGGNDNTASAEEATVGGGSGNTASSRVSTVSGGELNQATSAGATVGGGSQNIASGNSSTVAGGALNLSSNNSTTVGGGSNNQATAQGSTVAGGVLNVASNTDAAVVGGGSNTASGLFSTVGGGFTNTAAGDYSLAAGRQVNVNSSADYTFAFGNNFTTSASHAAILYDAATPIKVGIQNTAPIATLHVGGTTYLEGIATIGTGAFLEHHLRSAADGGARILGQQGNTAAKPAIGFFSTNGEDDGGGGNGIFRPSANEMAFSTTSLERMRINSPGYVGIATTDPKTYVDVNGDLALRAGSFGAVNLPILNNDINIGKRSFVRITGPTGAFSITGIAGGTDGKMVILYNTTAFAMTIANDDGNSVAANRILTMTGAAVVTVGTGNVTLIYDAIAPNPRWIVTSLNP